MSPSIRSWWLVRGRSGCRLRSIWRSAANPWCCSTMPTGSARARARSASQSARWNSGTGSASASAWSTRAWCGASARSFTANRSSISSTCCPRTAISGRPSSTCSNSMRRPIWSIASRSLPDIDLRWRNKVVGLEPRNDGVALTIETPDGPYRLRAQFVVACDGARSSLRQMVGAEFAGQVFEDQFLIADVKMTAAFPTERWFWFDPPFHAGRSALLHKQPDDIWRIDLQLNRYADPAVEKLPENVRPRIARMLGHDKFDFEWISLYKFQCRRMDRFVHGRVIFAGDAAHQVSPFGARGANSGSRTPRIWRGSSTACCGGFRRRACWRATTSSAARRPTRTSANRPARPTSWRRTRTRRRGCARRCCRSPGKPIRQAHGQCRAALGAVDLRVAAVDRRWRCVARWPAARRVDAGCADYGALRRADVSDRGFHPAGNAVHVAGVWQWRRDRRAGRRRRDPHRRRCRLCRYRGLAARATMPSREPPICCGPTAMSRRASVTRPRPALGAAVSRASGLN